jgi:prepilin-type N-terminal cleavage/methylation domain-containing protein
MSYSMRKRRGVTLLEVLVATALFAMASVVLSQLLHIGSQAAMRAELESVAAAHCDSIMAEILATGKVPPTEGLQPIVNATPWEFGVIRQPYNVPGLTQLSVVVRHRTLPQLGEFELSRLVQTARISDSPAASPAASPPPRGAAR